MVEMRWVRRRKPTHFTDGDPMVAVRWKTVRVLQYRLQVPAGYWLDWQDVPVAEGG